MTRKKETTRLKPIYRSYCSASCRLNDK